MHYHVEVDLDVVEVVHQLLVCWKLDPHVQEGRDQLTRVLLVLWNVPPQPILLDCIQFDLPCVVHKLHEDLVELAWLEINKQQTTNVTEEGKSLDSTSCVHVHQDELQFVLSVS